MNTDAPSQARVSVVRMGASVGGEGVRTEIRAVHEDMPDHVPSFFRDPEMFESLRTHVFPELLEHTPEGIPVRMWVAGCSTGEEVYSLAIAWLEFAKDSPARHRIQLLGSDVSEAAIQKARAGVYSDSSVRDVSDEHRKRYFTKTDKGHRIDESVRKLCVFARHDLVRDPPFSRMALVCCRNVLIDFDDSRQKRLIPMLQHSLSQPGFLVLGRGENISGFTRLFSVVDEDRRIFARTTATSDLPVAPRPSSNRPSAVPADGHGRPADRSTVLTKHLDRLLLARYCPPGVLVDENMDILLFHGHTGAYLQPASGQPRSNLLGMARDGLISPLRATLAQARQSAAVVRRPGVEVEQDGGTKSCDIVVLPLGGLPDDQQPLFVVLFEEHDPGGAREAVPLRIMDAPTDASTEQRRSGRLEHELTVTKEYVRTLIEEYGDTNDALNSSNQELMSGNEELQCMNEELETAKEELQSINQEQTTLNDELQSRVAEALEARSEAERSNRAKDDFLAVLSHELRTPLSSMLLNAQRLRDGHVVDRSDAQRTGESLERATRMQVKLIDDLLDVSRIVAGKVTLDCRAVDLCSVVRALIDGVAPLIDTKSLALNVSLDPALGPIWADRGRVQGVVSNLLSNAIKFTPPGGQLTIVVDAVAGFARLRVTDTGIGIEPGFLPHVFGRFAQSDSSITREYGGLGLGLALVRHLVELQGGTVHAESGGAGQGAAFTVTFPLAPVAEEVHPEPAPAPLPNQALARLGNRDALTDLRILFVDDDLRTREAVLDVLQETGACVELAASAVEGRAAIDAFRPQVILCDIAMPGEDGYTFMRRLRARESKGGTPIPALALTAMATEDDRRRALAAGFQMHLTKPIDIDGLREAVLELSTLVMPPSTKTQPPPDAE